MPSKCPTCGEYETVRYVLGVLGHGYEPTERERRTIEYVHTALDERAYDAVCSECRTVLDEVDESHAEGKGGGETEVVAKV